MYVNTQVDSQSCLDVKHWPRVVNFTVKNGDALDLDMNQNFTIFGKIENQISANQPLKHFTLSLINMYINDQVNDCLSAKLNTSEGILKKK